MNKYVTKQFETIVVKYKMSLSLQTAITLSNVNALLYVYLKITEITICTILRTPFVNIVQCLQ